MIKIVRNDDIKQIWRDNKQIGFVDENSVLHGIKKSDGFSYEICPIGHDGEIEKLLTKWLKNNK